MPERWRFIAPTPSINSRNTPLFFLTVFSVPSVLSRPEACLAGKQKGRLDYFDSAPVYASGVQITPYAISVECIEANVW
jgi:hypothetical protein